MEKLLEKMRDFVTKELFQILLGLFLVAMGFNAFKEYKIDVSNEILQWVFVTIGICVALPGMANYYNQFFIGDTEDKNSDKSDDFYKSRYKPIIESYLAKDKFHFVALVVNDERIIFDENCLNNGLRSNLTKGIDFHLKKYREYSIALAKNVQQLDTKLDRIVEEGDLIRLVFDVEQGGLFLGKVLSRQKVYIFAVNVIQDNMDECTRLMGELMDEIRIKVHNLPPWAKTKRP